MFSSRDLRATTIGWEIAIPIVGGPLFGFILDRRFDTGVRWTFILLGIGLVAGITAVIKYLKYEFYAMNKEMEADKANQTKKKYGEITMPSNLVKILWILFWSLVAAGWNIISFQWLKKSIDKIGPQTYERKAGLKMIVTRRIIVFISIGLLLYMALKPNQWQLSRWWL